MAFIQREKYITKSLIVDGSIEADQIATDSITANKFKGATEEQYFNKFDNITSIPFNTYTTLHEFDFPRPELSLVKSQSIEATFDANLYTGQSATVGSSVYMYIEVKVPNSPTFRDIGLFTHESYPKANYQRIYAQGNYLNRFGVGQVGSTGSYREYENLKFEQHHVLTTTNAVANGGFSGTSNWTAVSGILTNQYGVLGEIKQDSTSEKAHIYQELSTTSGTYYQFKKTSYGSSSVNSKFYLSTSTDVSDAFFSTTHAAGQTEITEHIVKIDHDTVYVIVENQGSNLNDYVWVDDIGLYETEPRTYVDVSTTGGQVIYNTQRLYHHPFGNAAGGTWKVVKEKIMSVRSNSYTTYITLNAEAFLGIEKQFHECRIRMRHFFSGDTITITDGRVLMKSRMTGEQNE